MYVTEFGLSNIRGFTGARAVEALALPQPEDGGSWTVIAGRNGSGKSTVLRALALALAGPHVARTLSQDFSSWITTGETAAWSRVAVSPDYTVDQLTGRGPGPDGLMMLGLHWKLPDCGDVPSGNPFDSPVQPSLSPFDDVRYGSPSPSARGPWSDHPQGWFCAAYGPFRRLAGGSGQAQRMMVSPGPAGRMASLFHEDASLAEGVSWLKELRLRSLEGREEATELLDIVKELLSDGLLPDGYRALRVSSEGLWVAPVDALDRAYPLREMSDGFRTVVALVLDLVRQLQTTYGTLDAGTDDAGHPLVRMPGVVIVDEVDAHLHVTWQRRIGDWLKSHFPRIQFIVTSHSPYICQAADPGGLIRLSGPEEQRAPEVVAPDLYQRIVYGSGEDAVLSELFGLETPYSERADKLRRLLVHLEEKVFDGEASDSEVAEYKKLAAELTSSRTARVYEMAAHLAGEE
ncbi:AAA family ATPase [Streptomyces sp. NPDC005438]|uniref:AAA family ATPase n=1 Tax=Streptomyces sp. NPDC005438 TaxID=3156880 RepID=UPI0033B78E83